MKRAAVPLVAAVLLLLTLQMRGAALAARFEFYSEATFTPDHHVILRLAPYLTDDDAHLRLYRVPASQLISLNIAEGQINGGRFGAEAPLREMDVQRDLSADRVSPNGSRTVGEYHVDLGVLPIGVYAAVWTLGDGRSVQMVTVGTLGSLVVTNYLQNQDVMVPVDLRTSRLRRDANYALYTSKGSEALSSDANGLFTIGAGERAVAVGRAPDGSLSLTHFFPRTRDLKERVAVQTDRPIYRPGQSIFYRAVVREGDVGEFTIPAGRRDVELVSNYSDVVARTASDLSAFGTLSGEFKLPADAKAGSYLVRIGDRTEGTNFGQIEVQAYRRPEYVIEAKPLQPYFIGGEVARFSVSVAYLSGRPAGGISIHYEARRSADFYFLSYRSAASLYRFSGDAPRPSQTNEPPVSGERVADADGRAEIDVPTSPGDFESQLQLQIDVRDASEHTVSAETRARITPATFYLRVLPKSYFQKVGEAATLDVTSSGYDGRARPAVDVRIDFAREQYDREARGMVTTPLPDLSRSATTGNDGRVSITWNPPSPGYFRITARATDERRRAVQTVWNLWVVGAGGPTYSFENVALAPQKDSYHSDEPVNLLATVPRGDVDALLVIANGASQETRLVHLPQAISTLTVMPPRDAAQFRVSLILLSTRAMTTTLVKIDPAPRQLTVKLHPNQERYEPGARAEFALDVTDRQGRPAQVEIALGIVDDAIYALRQRQALSPFDALYRSVMAYPGSQTNYNALNDPASAYVVASLVSIGRVTSRSADLIRPGTVADVYSVSAPSFENLRTDFRETAYWSPAIRTDPAGHAEIAFTWPDSLTSYTANASAVTMSSDAGDAVAQSLVTKDFFVRLEIPRFLRSGDEATIVGIAQGKKGAPGAALRLSAPALGIEDDRTDVTFDAFSNAAHDWRVKATGTGLATVKLAGASQKASDGVELSLPIESSGVAEHLRGAGAILSPQAPAAFDLDVPQGIDAGDARITVVPSALAELSSDLRLLQVYPYYCTEQTLSAALPMAFLDRAASRFGFAVRGPAAQEVARRAIERLGTLQHADGSWGWWEHDAAHPFMTAYALYGLAELRNAGYSDASYTIERGRQSLLAQLREQNSDTLAFWGGAQPDSQWNTRAFMLFALAEADPKRFDRTLLHNADEHAEVMNSYALAVLGLAHHRSDDDEGARSVLRRLDSRAIEDRSYLYWRGSGWHYRWEDDPIETTAYALRLEHALGTNATRLAKIVSWLRSQSRGSSWYTTKDTAAAIDALAETIEPSSNEMTPHETVRVTLNGKDVKSFRFDSAYATGTAETSFVIPAPNLMTGGRLEFAREGSGNAYWTVDWTRYRTRSGSTGQQLSPVEMDRVGRLHADVTPAFDVTRNYRVGHAGPWRAGDVVEVEVDLVAKSAQQYVAIEDPFPAGLEYQPLQYRSGMDWSGIQFLDDRAVFFATRLHAGQRVQLNYRLRAMTTGSFTAPAPTAYAMYGPPVTAIGSSERVTIAKEKH